MMYAIIPLAFVVYAFRIKELLKSIKSKDNAQRKAEIFYLVLTTVLFAGLSYFVLNMN